MSFLDQFRTAWRNLSRQKLRTSLTIFAIVIGAVSVTVMLSLVTSTKGFLVSSAEQIGMDRSVIVTGLPGLGYRESQWNWPDGSGKRMDADSLALVEKIENVGSATLYINGGMFESFSFEGRDITMKNIQTESYTPNGTVKHILVAGDELSSSTNGSGLLISSNIAKDLGYKGNEQALIGKEILLRYRKDFGPPEAKKSDEAGKIIGVTSSDGQRLMSADLDWAIAMQTLTWTQKGPNGQTVTNTDSQIDRNGFGSIWVSVNDKKNVDAVMGEVKQLGFGAAAGKEEIDNQ
ncbi:MAG: ABC transporter permease, partial [Actinomycetota bacterium]